MIIKGKAAVSRSINLHKNLHLIICTSGQKSFSQTNQLNKICIIYYNKETLIRQKGPFPYDYI